MSRESTALPEQLNELRRQTARVVEPTFQHSAQNPFRPNRHSEWTHDRPLEDREQDAGECRADTDASSTTVVVRVDRHDARRVSATTRCQTERNRATDRFTYHGGFPNIGRLEKL